MKLVSSSPAFEHSKCTFIADLAAVESNENQWNWKTHLVGESVAIIVMQAVSLDVVAQIVIRIIAFEGGLCAIHQNTTFFTFKHFACRRSRSKKPKNQNSIPDLDARLTTAAFNVQLPRRHFHSNRKRLTPKPTNFETFSRAHCGRSPNRTERC